MKAFAGGKHFGLRLGGRAGMKTIPGNGLITRNALDVAGYLEWASRQRRQTCNGVAQQLPRPRRRHGFAIPPHVWRGFWPVGSAPGSEGAGVPGARCAR
jgi:hypothetical protein